MKSRIAIFSLESTHKSRIQTKSRRVTALVSMHSRDIEVSVKKVDTKAKLRKSNKKEKKKL